MITLKKAGPTGGDETAPFEVVFDPEITVEQFVNEILKCHEREFGEIKWVLELFDSITMAPQFELNKIKYYKGSLKNEIPEDIKNKKLIQANAHGGWGMMDYFIKF